MNELALKVENVSKEYRLGAIGGGTLKGDIQSALARMRHKEDPNSKIGTEIYSKNERFLAVNGVSFEVKKGETLGIIGHNGAGKSTILKLICRVTAPTKGKIQMNGHLTSMLEVGTGFHPELTGRENVYLNGAILGMSRSEISRKFDEIVAFSEVGEFIDTPIKRYSSGMKVKLAFAVASHLDSEIMIMDEVLAVGDINFQNKCIERMKKLAEEEGRTILYVSHNMASVKRLCDRCIVLAHGQKIFDGDTDAAIAIYMRENVEEKTFFDLTKYERNNKCNQRHLLEAIQIIDSKSNMFRYGDIIRFRLKWHSNNDYERVKIKAVISANDVESVGVTFGGVLNQNVGENSVDYRFDTKYLIPGRYILYFKVYDEDNSGNVVYYDQCRGFSFTITHSEQSLEIRHWFADWGKTVLPCLKFDKTGYKKSSKD